MLNSLSGLVIFELLSRVGFLSLITTDILGYIILCYGGIPLLIRTYRSLYGLCLLDASSVPSSWDRKFLQILSNFPENGEISPSWAFLLSGRLFLMGRPINPHHLGQVIISGKSLLITCLAGKDVTIRPPKISVDEGYWELLHSSYWYAQSIISIFVDMTTKPSTVSSTPSPENFCFFSLKINFVPG